MSTATKERRGRRRGKTTLPLTCTLLGQNAQSRNAQWEAAIWDSSQEGLGVESETPLAPGTFCHLELSPPAIAFGIRPDPWVRVRWCEPIGCGRYRIGLEYAVSKGEDSHAAADRFAGGEDLYEVLQLNPKAEPDTIHRVYRLLAQRFHPDNSETGDEEEFKRITKAYEVLGDPARRASYDAQFSSTQSRRWKIFHSPEAAKGLPSEKPKRFAILHALYLKRVCDPYAPTMSVLELEDLLAVPREHLEFTIWYLKERGFIQRSDNNRLQITVAGIDYAEALAAEDRALPPELRLLPAAPVAD